MITMQHSSQGRVVSLAVSLLLFASSPSAADMPLAWLRQFGTDRFDTGQSVSADSLGNVFVTGSTLGNLGGPNAGDEDVFVSKFNAAGVVQWTRLWGTPGEDSGRAVSADGLGNVYVTGHTDGVLLDPNVGGPGNAHLSRYTAEGIREWTVFLGTDEAEAGNGVAADRLGNIYVTGLTGGELAGPNAGLEDAYLAKFDAAGRRQWTRQFGTDGLDAGDDVAADGAGNVYLLSYTFDAPDSLVDGAYLRKYDANGSLLWSRQVADEPAQGVAADELGNVYITGYTRTTRYDGLYGSVDAYMTKYAADGTLGWLRFLGTPVEDQALSVSADRLGNVFVAGNTRGSLGGAYAGESDAFLARYHADGTFQESRQLGSIADERGHGISADGLGNVFLVGTTEGDLGGVNLGISDGFVARFVIPEPHSISLLVVGGVLVAAWRSVRCYRSR